MKNSIYSTAGGMLTTAERLNTIGNNLANFSTNGFKGDIPFEQTIKFLAEGPYPGKDQPVLGGNVINLDKGLITHTGRTLDLAFESDGFFTIQGPNNQQFMTRNGAFDLNSNKELVTAEGYYVLDKFDNKITVFGEKLEFSSNGDVFIDGTYFTTLKVVNVTDRNELEKVGDTFFKMKDDNKKPDLMENAQILPGALEKSNVDLLKGMGEMIRIERTFELQKTAADVILKELRKTITELPKPV